MVRNTRLDALRAAQGVSGALQAGRGRNKYGAKPAERDGITFASTLERDCYDVLRLLERVGRIHNLETQVPYELAPKHPGLRAVRMVWDFRFWVTRTTRLVVMDSKGRATEAWKVRFRWFKEVYPHVRAEVVLSPAGVLAAVERVEREG